MTKPTIKFIFFWIIIPIPIIATFYLSLKTNGIITPEALLITHLTNPQLWVMDCIPISYGLLTYFFIKNIEVRKEAKAKMHLYGSFILYRIIGLAWGVFVYFVAGSAIIFHDNGKISRELFVDYQLNHPLFIGLLFCVPLFFGLGYIVEKIFVTREESKLKSAEIAQQNLRLQEEIKEREKREKELVEAKQEAMMGVKAKDQFLSNMSHEIRTPMNGVIGLTDLLLDSDLTNEQREYALSIDHSAKNLLVLINQILDLSKINSEKLTLEYIDFNIRDYIKNVENTFKATAAEKGIVLRTIIDPQVPQMACGDPVRFNQILLNLTGNAIKFTDEGGVDLIISSTETDDGPRLSIEVNDTGIGIPEDKISAIFETFTQAGADTTRMYGGSGLGLAISKELVELYGGKLRVESMVGKGSSFSFEVQLRKAEGKKEVVTEEPSIIERFKEIDPKKIKILLAEDNRVNQLVVKSTLAKHGFEITIVPNGQEVIECIYKEHFDVILMDVQMPVMSGLDATRFIRNATEPPLSDIKIIAMTASVMKEDIDKCLAVGMDDYVPKPFKAIELFEKLCLHLESR